MPTEPTVGRCPACKAVGVRTPYVGTLLARHGVPVKVRHCGRCGWCSHGAHRDGRACPACGRPDRWQKEWRAAADLPRPAGMGDEEFAVRAALFAAWKAEPATGFLQRLSILADFFTDRDSPEEKAARADWRVYGQRKDDPRGWWQWTVPGDPGWVRVVTLGEKLANGAPVVIIDAVKARLGRTYHNAGYFLGWPPGFVRFTAPLSHDHKRWRVTVQPERSLTYSEPVEKVHPFGYATLFHPPGAVVRVGEAARVRDPVPDLFAMLGG